MATAAPDTRSVAIVGGGIGGLAAAAFLHRAGLNCTVYEQAPQLTEIGAGLVVAPNAARLLRRLGALEEFATRAVQLEVGFEFRRWEDGTVLSAEDLSAACEQLYGEHSDGRTASIARGKSYCRPHAHLTTESVSQRNQRSGG